MTGEALRNIETAKRLLRKFSSSQSHAVQVAKYCDIMAHALPADTWVHQDEDYIAGLFHRLYLAALLHDIGHAIADKGHHKHSRYLILHSALTQRWDEPLRNDVAAIALSHRKKASKSWLHERFFDQVDVMKLAALLRIADSLDRNHRGLVEITACSIQLGSFVLCVSHMSSELMDHVMTKKADLWKYVFPYSFVVKA